MCEIIGALASTHDICLLEFNCLEYNRLFLKQLELFHVLQILCKMGDN